MEQSGDAGKALEISNLEEIIDPDLSEAISSTFLMKLPPSECLAVNSQYICYSDNNDLIIIYKSDSDEKQTRVVSLPNKIKNLIIAKAGNFLVALIEIDGFHIIDIESSKEVLDIGKSQSTKNIKWHPRVPGILAINIEGLGLEIWTRVDQTFKSTSFDKKDIIAFDLSPGPSIEIGYIGNDGILKICDLESNTEQTISSQSIDDAIDIVFIDRDTLAVYSPIGITLYSRSPSFEPIAYSKSVFIYDPISEVALLSDFQSTQVSLFTKESIISQKYDETIDISLRSPHQQLEIQCKDITRRAIDIIIRHEDEIYKYPVVLSPESDLEEKELEPLESKEEAKAISENKADDAQKSASQKRKEKKSNRTPAKKNTKTKPIAEVTEFKPPEPPKQVPPKDMVTPIISCLNKRFDEVMRRLEKTLSEQTLSQVISKHLQANYENKGQDQLNAIKTALQSYIFQAFGNEFRTVLIPIFERDISENFKNMFFLLQETLRQSSERNAREEAKSQSLNAHMKNTIEGLNTLSKKLGKVAFKQLKRVEELEVVMVEKASAATTSTIEIPKVDTYVSKLKQEIEKYLNEKNFDKAITRLIEENNTNYLFKVLVLMDPRPLMMRDYLSSDTVLSLFYLLVSCVEQEKEFPDIMLWLEELCKKLPTGSSDLSKILARLCEVCDRNSKLRSIMKLYTMRLR